MKRHCVGLGLCVVILFATSGCEREATGQTVAVVNDEEISQNELNAELETANVPEGADKKEVLPQLLQRMVDRKLLAQRAIDQGIDRSPEYLTHERRMTEELLVRLMMDRQAANIKVPSDAEINRFISDNPTMFQQRTSLALNQIQFDPPSNVRLLVQLKDNQSLDEIAVTLTRLGVRFTRNRARLDTGSLPTDVSKQILALPPGEPFLVRSNGKIVANVITSREGIGIRSEKFRSIAIETIRRRRMNEFLNRQVNEARAAAEIKYQKGYAPAAPKAINQSNAAASK